MVELQTGFNTVAHLAVVSVTRLSVWIARALGGDMSRLAAIGAFQIVIPCWGVVTLLDEHWQLGKRLR